MKFLNLSIFCVLVISICQISYSQTKDANLVLVSSLSKPTYELLARNTDYLATEISQNPSSIGYIIIYGGINPIENSFYEKTVSRNIAFRKLDKKVFKIISAATSNKIRIEFLLSKNETKPIIRENEFGFVLPTDKAIHFADDLVTFDLDNARRTYYFSGCEGGCVFSADFNLLSKFLKANPSLSAFFIIHAKNLKTAASVKKFLLEGIDLKRLIFFYGGKNKINSNSFFEIEIYLAENKFLLKNLSLTSKRLN